MIALEKVEASLTKTKVLKTAIVDVCAELEEENRKRKITVGEWIKLKKNGVDVKKTLKNTIKTFDNTCFLW